MTKRDKINDLIELNPLTKILNHASGLLKEHPWWTVIVAIYWFVLGIFVGTSI